MEDKAIRKKYLKRAEKGVAFIYIVEDLDMINWNQAI
jgi:two-component system phosphate regulon sensor histidine kinase PhoR